jgi:hypothetical protein
MESFSNQHFHELLPFAMTSHKYQGATILSRNDS